MFAIDNPNIFIIILIVLAVLILVLVAIIIGVATRRPKTPAQAAKPEKAATATPARPHLQEILRLWRDPDTGRVVTEFQNRAIRDPRTLNKSERDYLVRLAKDWYAWLGMSEPPSAAKVEATPAATISPTEPTISSAPAPTPIEAMVPEPIAPPLPQASVPVTAPKINLAAAPILESPVPRSIVQQVDDIVQEKLAAHPGSIPAIKLVEDPYEGVIVWVNQTKYIGIESVTDPDVRAIIRSAAVEWEHRTGQ